MTDDFGRFKNIHLESMLLLRKLLAFSCGLLTPACILFGLFGLFSNPPYWYGSISATYYANSSIMMVGLLFSTGIFFLAYKGYDMRDRVVSLVQAISCFIIIIFPCKLSAIEGGVGLFNLPASVSHIIHCMGAGVLFFSFGFNLIFLFTLGQDEMTKKKKTRNFIYRLCGCIIWLFMIVQAVTSFIDIPAWFPMTLINEFVMLTAFSIAYLIKSESIKSLND